MLRPILFHKIHPIIKNLITQRDLGELLVSRSVKHFHMNREKLTSDQICPKLRTSDGKTMVIVFDVLPNVPFTTSETN